MYSELRKHPRLNLADQIPLDYPLTIYVETTNRCNFRCKFCPESLEDYERRSGGWSTMTLDSFKKICDQVQLLTGGKRIKTMNFYMMGEPLLNKDILRMTKYAKNKDLAERLILTTNGSLLHTKQAGEFIGSGLDYIRISIYGANQSVHEYVTRSRSKLDNIRRAAIGIRELRKEKKEDKPFIYIKMLDMGEKENAMFRNMFEGAGDEIAIEPRMDWNGSPENFSGIERDDLISSEYFGLKKVVCPYPFYTLVINSDLSVSVCCVDWERKLVVGNLNNETLTDIWKGEKLRRLQNAHLAGKRESIEGCKDCLYLHTAPDNIDARLGTILE